MVNETHYQSQGRVGCVKRQDVDTQPYVEKEIAYLWWFDLGRAVWQDEEEAR